MFATSDEQRAGLLVAVVTGGRPKLSQRPVAKFLDSLREAGVADIVWVVSERDAPGYEQDDNDLCVYPDDWAHQYAAEHWMLPTPPPEPGGFMGAFVGREWACLEAERRGCWGVLQLDDNIEALSFARGAVAGYRVVDHAGKLGLFADILAGVTLATNGRMVGAQLMAVPEPERKLCRPGFPYSLFIEQVGEGREHWYGPFEDDITHAFQYGDRPTASTAVVVPQLLYKKESKSKTGMRSKYNHERSVQLQRIFPHSAKVGIRATKANGMGDARVFHTMLPGAIRNPVCVEDRELFERVADRMADLREHWAELSLEMNRQKMLRRAAEHGLYPPGKGPNGPGETPEGDPQ